MPAAPVIQLVCFDLGGVLIRLCRDWNHACEAAGARVSPRKLDDAGATRFIELVHRSEIGQVGQDTFCREAAALFGVEPEQVNALSDAYLLGPFPGVTQLIDDINSCGRFTTCLSNTNASHWQLMNDRSHRAGLPLDRLTYRFASQLIGARKPDAAIYAHVERATQLAANQILFFDDRDENIQAAKNRGWHCHLVVSADDTVTEMRAALRALNVLR